MRLARGIAVLAVLATLGTDAAAQEMVVPSASVERVFIPWQAGNAASFQAGTPEEGGKRADGGRLPAAVDPRPRPHAGRWSRS
ncbi:MAG: hypothetical protein L6R19_22565 [Alphaproteobacteria bacterium]|nr:hypothetical protein [Alphaproteobacteria bacterium]